MQHPTESPCVPPRHISAAGSLVAQVLGSTLIVALFGSAAALAHNKNLCADAEPLAASELLWLDGSAGRACYETWLPSPGLLAVEVAVPAAAAVEARVQPDEPCAPVGKAMGKPMDRRSAEHLLVRVDALGTYRFCVGPQDPLAELGEHVLRTRFAALGGGEGIEKEGSDDEEEIDPNPSVWRPEGAPAGSWPRSARRLPESFRDRSAAIGGGEGVEKEGSDDEEEIDPNPSIWRPEGAPARGWPGSPWRLPESFLALCDPGLGDDHPDLLPCAAPLTHGRRIRATLDDPRGLDRDVFAFRLQELATVELSGTATGSTVSLLDAAGQPLRWTRAEDGSFRLVKTLAAGYYHVRLEQTAAAPVPYDLRLELLQD